MVLNQQLTEEKSDKFNNSLKSILEGWLPYTTNYIEIRKAGWDKEYREDNKYVEEFIKDTSSPYKKQYHDAWSRCPKKEEIIKLIKETAYLETEPALQIFKEITGINIEEQTEELTVDQICKELGRTIKIIK